MEDKGFALGGLLGAAFPDQAFPDGTTYADQKFVWQSLALPSPATAGSPSTTVTPASDHAGISAALEYLLDEEQSLQRAVNKLGINRVIEILVRQRGKEAIKTALGRVRQIRVHEGVSIARHALALFCEKFGHVGDSQAAQALAPFFPTRTGEHRQDSLRKLLSQARKQCASNELWRELAQRRADRWFEEGGASSVSLGLRRLNRHWKKESPF